MQVGHLEALQQPQNLNVFAPARLEHPRFHQPPQGLERRRQVPSDQRRRLVQCTDLLLQQRQIVHGVEDQFLGRIAPGMARDDRVSVVD